MFEQITDVPVALAEFYSENVVSEQVLDEAGEPVLAQEQYTYLDEEGVEQTGTKLVPTYEDVAYVVLAPRPQSVSWDKVNQIIEKHQGKRPDVVAKFTELAQATDKWRFHDEYLDWMNDCIEVDNYNSTDQLDEDGEIIIFEQKEYPEEPTFIPHDIKPLQLVEAKAVRDEGRYAPITVDDLTFDADPKAYDNMKGAVGSWDILVQDLQLTDIGLVDGSQMLWTLADNSTAFVTKDVLERVLAGVSIRAGLLQAQYMQSKV